MGLHPSFLSYANGMLEQVTDLLSVRHNSNNNSSGNNGSNCTNSNEKRPGYRLPVPINFQVGSM